MEKIKIKRHKTDPKTTFIVIAMFAVVFISEFLKIRFIPDTLIGESALEEAKTWIIADILCSVPLILLIMAACFIPVGAVVTLAVLRIKSNRLMRDLQSVMQEADMTLDENDKGTVSDPPFMRERRSSGIALGLLAVMMLILTVSLVSESLIPLFKDNGGIVSRIKLAVCISDDLEDRVTETEDFENVMFSSVKGGVSHMVCRNSGGDKRFILSGNDVYSLRKQYRSYERVAAHVEYYKNSKIIKSVEFSKSVELSEDIASYPQVSISMDDSWELYRPENMEDYGRIAWVVLRDGVLVQKNPDDIPYSVNADHYVSTNLEEDRLIREDGSYEVYLVKVIVTPDEEGLYRNVSVFKISNSITFVIKDGEKADQ